MRMSHFNIKPIAAALIVAGLLSACGGGGSNNNQTPSDQTTSGASNNTGGTNQPAGNTNNPGTTTGGNTNTSSGGTQTTPASTVMSCVDGDNYQCSGENIVGPGGEVTLTDFGVQAYGKATSDLGKTIFNAGEASNSTGYMPDTGGVTQIRMARDNNGAISRVALILSKIGIQWDGLKERPTIIETFDPNRGRTTFGDKNKIIPDTFHESSDIAFYDYATKGTAGTQEHYANNRYFPRSAGARCPTGSESWCKQTETDGLHYVAGTWRTGGNQPDSVSALRFHEDGDVHAGNASNNGDPLPGGNGEGVPFPGSKGFRTFNGLSYQYSNLGTWFTADTVWIAEWTGQDGRREHSTNRRGVVAFGALTNPDIIPKTGSATYSGRVYGRYSKAKDADPDVFEGNATIKVNFATREVEISIQPDVAAPEVTTAVSFSAKTTLGAAGSSLANTSNGSVNNGRLSGKVSGRYFGPLIAAGNGSQVPAETGGAFSLTNETTGEAAVGGFIARKPQ